MSDLDNAISFMYIKIAADWLEDWYNKQSLYVNVSFDANFSVQNRATHWFLDFGQNKGLINYSRSYQQIVILKVISYTQCIHAVVLVNPAPLCYLSTPPPHCTN